MTMFDVPSTLLYYIGTLLFQASRWQPPRYYSKSSGTHELIDLSSKIIHLP